MLLVVLSNVLSVYLSYLLISITAQKPFKLRVV